MSQDRQSACLMILVVVFIAAGVAAGEIGPISAALRQELRLDPFYQRHLDAGGLPIVSSAKVTNHALAEAAWIVERMLAGRPDLLRAMAANKVRVVVMAGSEYTTDLPEHRELRTQMFWDRRARGLGATLTTPVASVGEENLLGWRGDPYPKENIFVHEFAHAIHATGLRSIDPTFDDRLRTTYQSALDRQLWQHTYAATNADEYWAEGVQCWFDDNAPPNASHNHIRTRLQLKDYDPGLARLCEEVFGDGPWRYVRPRLRAAEELTHLPGYDPEKLPRFRWRESPVIDQPRVAIQTTVGEFEIELDATVNRSAVTYFLMIALDGGYHSGQFHRRQLDDTTPVNGFIEAKIKPNWVDEAVPRLDLPTLSASTAPIGPDAVLLCRQSEPIGSFLITAGVPSMLPADAIPIGRVTKGADIVRTMLTSPADRGAFQPPILIRYVIRFE